MLQFQKLKVKEEKNEQTSLGFDEQSKLSIFASNIKRRFKRLNQEVKYSGVYNNFWLWNMFFLHIAVAVALSLLLAKYQSVLPESIGVTVDNVRRFDTVLNKNSLYAIIAFHVINALVTVGMGLKSEKRLNHLLIASFFNFAVLAVYEFLALRDFIFYFL